MMRKISISLNSSIPSIIGGTESSQKLSHKVIAHGLISVRYYFPVPATNPPPDRKQDLLRRPCINSIMGIMKPSGKRHIKHVPTWSQYGYQERFDPVISVQSRDHGVFLIPSFAPNVGTSEPIPVIPLIQSITPI